MGPDPVSLIRGRSVTSLESWSWPFPRGICGIVAQDYLVGQITSYAQGDRFLVLVSDDKLPGYHHNRDVVAVVDFLDPRAQVSWFHTTEEALTHCAGDSRLGTALSWQTFDQGLERAERIRTVMELLEWIPLMIIIVILVTMLAWSRVGPTAAGKLRRRTAFLCIFSAVIAVDAMLAALLFAEFHPWLTALLAAFVGMKALSDFGKLKKAQATLPDAYRSAAVAAVYLGWFGVVALPVLLVFVAGHLR